MPDYDDKAEGMEMLLTGLATGDTDGLIEASEARGQQALVASADLPIDIRPALSREDITKATGIEFGEVVNDIFVEVKLPEGWEKAATDHNMWSHLVDDKGRRRAGIFYKAAFYDRSAHMHFEPFYTLDAYGEEGVVKVVDANGNVLHNEPYAVIEGDHHARWAAEDLARKWLVEAYPDHGNPFSYWD